MASDLTNILGATLVKALCDKSYDKRKIAAGEVETLIKSYRRIEGGDIKIQKLLDAIKHDFMENHQSAYRKGGLIALASAAIGLEVDAGRFVESLAPCVIQCFADQESRVRYYACEALYNVTKVARRDILVFLEDIFDGLCRLFADVDSEVRNGAQYLDRLLKDVVTEAHTHTQTHNTHTDTHTCVMSVIVPLLAQRLKVINPYVRQLMLSWICVLDSMPESDMLRRLPLFLEGLFSSLSDVNRELRQGADSCMAEFLRELRHSDTLDARNVISEISPAVITACQSRQTFVRLTANVWLHSFVERATTIPSLRKLFPQYLSCVLGCLDDDEAEIDRIALASHHALLAAVAAAGETAEDASTTTDDANETSELEVAALVNVILDKLQLSGTECRVSCLAWVTMLLTKRPKEIEAHTHTLVELVFNTVKHPDSEVVVAALQVLALMSRVGSSLVTLATRLLALFREDHNMLEQRGRLVVRQLCLHVDCEQFYLTAASALQVETDLALAHQTAHLLNWTLLTSKETRAFREKLVNAPSASLVKALVVPWMHNPVSALSLSLWLGEYMLAFELVKRLAILEPSVEFLVQLDQLVHLLETPIFARLRLHLLELNTHAYLLKALLGVLMLLPQATAFQILQRRLEVVNNTLLYRDDTSSVLSKKKETTDKDTHTHTHTHTQKQTIKQIN
eukprot:GHVR01005147.1.p1 GENE.GHVR01005147.1~~GHVR01005147.1.p1  ORF type:complete len:683 (-),score=190.96 GHVR01005147.1:78-2126(-)